jgi:hypothetical protein
VEDLHEERTKAAWQLAECIQRARVAHPNSGEAVEKGVENILGQDDAFEETFLKIGDRMVPSQPDSITQAEEARLSMLPSAAAAQGTTAGTASKKITAVFGRRRTHNEQLLVNPCGVIVARETFFDAESVPTAVVCII